MCVHMCFLFNSKTSVRFCFTMVHEGLMFRSMKQFQSEDPGFVSWRCVMISVLVSSSNLFGLDQLIRGTSVIRFVFVHVSSFKALTSSQH